MKRIIIITLSALTLLSSCSGYDSRTFESAAAMVEDAKGKVEWISAGELSKVIEDGGIYYLVDVREQSEFDISCIKGANSVPRGVLEDMISEKAPGKRKPLYIYCSNGDRSALAGTILPLLKYSDVKVLEGGFDNWQIRFLTLWSSLRYAAPLKPR
ncbi:hypothetical protein MASR1M46_18170 [Bacteroidales bacterium]